MQTILPTSERGDGYDFLRSSTEAAGNAYLLANGAYSLISAGQSILAARQASATFSRTSWTSESFAKEAVISQKFRPFNEYNYRYNLKILTKTSPPSNIDAHHVFPQEFMEYFIEKGINIHKPQYLTWWHESTHRPNAFNYNMVWREFIRKHPNATVPQILEEGKQIMAEYGITTNY